MKTVLLIEDNADIRENMAEILELASYSVLLAENGKEGAAMAIQHKPDIIVCDIMMPELDGYGVIHLLQRNDSTRNIPFIFLTAKTERAEVRKGMELGADDYITKPFSGTELLNAIEGRLKKAAQQTVITPAVSDTEESAGNLQQEFIRLQEIQTFAKKERIYREGGKPFRLYQVQSGSVKLYKTHEDGKDLILSIYHPGEYFGYTALLENAPYAGTAEAIEETVIASIPKEAVDALLENSPQVLRQFVKLLAGNVLEKEEQLLGIAYNSLRKKVAEALLKAFRKTNTHPDNAPPSINMSRETLASLAGTAKESLIRTLSDFRTEGLIEMQGLQIVLLQKERLAKLLN